MTRLFLGLILLFSISGCIAQTEKTETNETSEKKDMKTYPKEKSDEQWKEELSTEEYQVIREKGTERPYTGQYNDFFKAGTYYCKGCGEPLFSSDMKFDSHCGWPSFDSELPGAQIEQIRDTTHGMIRTEIVCSKCGGHLGHIFDDGPTNTGMRYCVNSVSLDFEEKKEDK